MWRSMYQSMTTGQRRSDPVPPGQLDDDSPSSRSLCASCGSDWDLRTDPEDAGVWYCGRYWYQWECAYS